MELTTSKTNKPSLHSLPTPNLADRIYVVHRDALPSTYQLPAPGTAWSEYDHTGKMNGFLFATAQPSEKEGYVREFWINERANQDSHNFLIEYPYVDTSYPRLIRTYVLLRAGLSEPNAGTADAVFTNLKLIEHKQIQLEDPIINSLFVGVQRVYEKVPGPTLTSKNLIDQSAMGAESTTVEQKVAAGSSPPTADFYTLSATQQQIDAATAVNRKTSVESFPTLVGGAPDNQTSIIVEIEKKIVEAGTKPSVSSGWHREIQPLDRLRSIQIASKIDLSSLPSPESWKHTVQKSFPGVLIDQYFLCYVAIDGFRADSSIPFRCDIQDPFSAACEAETVRTFLSSAPTGTEKETPFNTQSHQIRVAAVGNNGRLIESVGVIPAVLHGELSERWGVFQEGSGWLGVSGSRPTPAAGTSCFVTPFAEGPIAATSPATLTSGGEFTHKVHVERWRFDIWVKYVTTAKIP